MPGTKAFVIGPLWSNDLVAVAQCIAIDGSVFPFASWPFGSRDPSARVWVARDGQTQRIRGFLAGRARGRDFHVDGLAVDRDARRRGLGRALLHACTHGAREQALSRVVLFVATANRAALALYEAEGFVRRRRLRGFYRASVEGGPDAYQMELAL